MSESTQLAVFSFRGNEIRTVTESNEPMFCLADVCRALDIANPRDCRNRLNQKGVVTADTLTSGGVQSMVYISEQNLYKVIFQSRKPEAEAFTDWVTGEVLPAIRRDGGYMVAKPDETPEQLYQRCMTMLNTTIERQKAQIAEQGEQLKLQAPDVEYCHTVLASSSLITVNTIAAHLGVSARRLNAFLGGEGWIYRQGRTWCPSFKIRNRGYCDYETIPYTNRAGDDCTAHNLKWTEPGRRAVIELWNKRHNSSISTEVR